MAWKLITALATVIWAAIPTPAWCQDHIPPPPIQGIEMPMAASDEEALALLRKQSPLMYAAKMCSRETIKAYGDRWERVSVDTMNHEMTVLHCACLIAVMPPDWSEADHFRKYAMKNYDTALLADPTFPPPNFHNTYGIK